MKIAVIGTGGVGGYYGGLLAQQGHDVTFVARGAHLDAIRKNGLQVKSVFGDFHVAPAQATDRPAGIGTVDLALFCVKTYSTDESVQAIQPIVGPQTAVLSLQNGVDAVDRIGAAVGMDHVLGGATWISSALEAPGVINQMSQFRRIVFGELDGRVTPRVQAIFDAFQPTGATVEISQDILKILWTKFVFIAAASGFGGLTRLPMSEYRAVPETRTQIMNLMKEVEAVGNAFHAHMDADVVEKSLEFMDVAAPHIKASMQLDVDAGRQFELDAMIGVIGRKGREAGIPTPTADMLYALLLPIQLRALKGQ